MGRAVFISGLVRTDVSRFLVPACLALVRRLLTSPLVLPLCRYPGERFSGAQLHTCVDDLPTGPGSVFEASIMPLTSYAGYLPASPWQVDAILDALTPLLARPIAQLRLRWGHEVNYYASDAGPGPGPGPSPSSSSATASSSSTATAKPLPVQPPVMAGGQSWRLATAGGDNNARVRQPDPNPCPLSTH